jgi:tetratricopeptide (TPR) repeat protein
LETALAEEPENAEIQALLQQSRYKWRVNNQTILAQAKKLFAENKLELAARKFKFLLNQDPGNREAVSYLKKINRTEEIAVKNSEKLRKQYYEGVGFYLEGRYEEAMKKWREILKVDPQNQDAASSLGIVEDELAGMRKLKKNQ